MDGPEFARRASLHMLMRSALVLPLLCAFVWAQAIPGKLIEYELPARKKKGEPLVYAIYASSKWDPEKPAPLIFAIHAGTGTAKRFVGFLRSLGEAQGALVVGPQGFREVVGADGYWWKGDTKEMATFNRLLEHIKKTHKIDPKRVTMVGLADGAEIGLKWAMAKDRGLQGIILLNFLWKNPPLRAKKEFKTVLFASAKAREKTAYLAKHAAAAEKALERQKRPVVLRIMPGSSRSFFRSWEKEFRKAYQWFEGKLDWPKELAVPLGLEDR